MNGLDSDSEFSADAQQVAGLLRLAQIRLDILQNMARNFGPDNDLGPFWGSVGLALAESALTRLHTATVDDGSASQSLATLQHDIRINSEHFTDSSRHKRLGRPNAQLRPVDRVLGELGDLIEGLKTFFLQVTEHPVRVGNMPDQVTITRLSLGSIAGIVQTAEHGLGLVSELFDGVFHVIAEPSPHRDSVAEATVAQLRATQK